MSGHRLSRLAKGTPSESWLFIGTIGLGNTVSCRLCAGQSKGTLKRGKCCFWIWLRPRYKIPEFFTIAPVLTSTLTVCRRNRGNPSTLYSTYDALQVLQKYSCSCLAWIRPRADRGLSRPTSVFHTTIGV